MYIFKYQTDPINMCQPKNFQLRHEMKLKWCQAVKSNRHRTGKVFIGTSCSESLAASQEASRSSSSLAEAFCHSRRFVLGRERKICSLKSKISEDGQTGISLSTAFSVCKSGHSSTLYRSFKTFSVTRNCARKFA